MTIDLQRQKVYNWEREFVSPKDTNSLLLDKVQMIVNYVWQNEGLEYPPIVEPLPKRYIKVAGDATRTTVRFKEKTHTWIVLHELAHSMTSTVEGESNQHGALFVGIYVQLLSRYLNMNYGDLVDSIKDRGIKIKLDARPVFL